MKISILSDMHLDFYIKAHKQKLSAQFWGRMENYLDAAEDVEVLIVAGDITHYNHQIEHLKTIAEYFNYKKIFCVLGNHDLYLVSQSQKNKYKDSKKRQEAWYNYKDPDGIIEILNGEISEYKGVTFGGAMSWYDGTMKGVPQMYSYVSPVMEWKQVMNDSRMIYGYEDFYDIYNQEKPKIEAIQAADVIITHICPLAENLAFQKQYQGQSSNKFYCFDGEDYLDKTSASTWVYGHSHGYHDFEVYGVQCVMNAMGYPNEMTDCKKTTLEVTLDPDGPKRTKTVIL